MRRKMSRRPAGRLLAALSAVVLLAATGLTPLPIVRAEEAPAALQGLELLESGSLLFGLDAATGLGKVYDKRTGRIWTQYAAAPPQDTEIPPVPLTDTGYWTRAGAVTDRNNPRADEGTVLFDLNGDFQGGQVATVTPGNKVVRGNYRIEVTYTAEEAADFGLDITVGFRTNHYDFKSGHQNYLGTERGDTYICRGTESGTHTLTMELSEAAFQEHTAFANITVDVLAGGERTAGKIYIEKIAMVALGGSGEGVVLSDVKNSGAALTFQVNSAFRQAAGQPAFQGRIAFDGEDLVYTVSAASPEDDFAGRLLFPATFHNGSDSLKWALPNNSGAYLSPFDLNSDINKKLALGEFYYNVGLSMAFIGADDGENGGYLEIVDTPVLAGTLYPLCDIGSKAGYLPQVAFEGDKYRWSEDRQVRFRFLENGSYVNLAKEYRKIAAEKGFLVTYEEKAAANPVVRQSTGAHRVDLGIDKRSVLDFFARMKEAGITNIMVKVNGVRDAEKGYAGCSLQELIDDGLFEQIKAQYPEYLLYDYEFARESVLGDYPDIIRPAGYAEFADDYISVDGNGNQRIWLIRDEFTARVLCPTVNIPYIDFMYDLFPYEIYPAKSRMYDTLATSPMGEGQCGDPKHPCNRTQTYEIKRDAMKYLTETYGIDAHTEGNAEYLVPYVNSFEGSIDLLALQGYGYLLIDNRPMSENFPNEAEKIPLWQLVFHDCGATYWHWEYGELSNTAMNRYCDLYTMLYGEHGMFLPKYAKTHVYSSYFDTMIDRIKTLNQVTEKVAYDEMLSHEFLSEDGMVQRTAFSSGLQVTVNFSKEKSYDVDGEPLEPQAYRLTGTGAADTSGPAGASSHSTGGGSRGSWILYAVTAGIVVLIAAGTVTAIVLKKRKKAK